MANKQLSATIVIGGTVSGALLGAIGKTQRSLAAVGQTIREVEQRQRMLGQTINDFDRMGRNVGGLRAEYARLTAQIERLRAAKQQLAATDRAIQANLQRRADLRGQMFDAVAIGSAVAFPVGSAMSNAANFSRELQLIGNTADLTEPQIKALGDTVLRTAKATNQYADEVVAATGYLVAAGMDAREAGQFIGAYGKTATATGAALRDVATTGWVLRDSLELSTFADQQRGLEVLAKAAKMGAVEFREMAGVTPVLGAGFKALKMEGLEAAATMGAALQIARKGASSGEQAATNLENFLAKVMSPETRKKAMENFGVDIAGIITRAQAKGENPFEAAVQAIAKMTKGGDQRLLGDLFQDMQVQNFIRPMLQNWSEYQRIKREALGEGSKGMIDRDFARMMEEPAEKMKQAKIAADDLSKALGRALAPAAGDLAATLTPVIGRITEFVQANPALVAGIAKGVMALAALKVGAVAAGYALTFVRGGWLNMVAGFQRARVGAAMAQVGASTAAAGGSVATLGGMFGRLAGLAMPVLTSLGAAIGGLSAPVLLVGAAIAAIGALVWKYWEPIKAWVIGFAQGVREGFAPVFAEIAATLAPLRPAFDMVAAAVGRVWQWFKSLLEPVRLTGDEAAAVTEKGREFGRIVGAAIGALFLPLRLTARLFVAVGTAAGTAAGWVVAKFTGAIEWFRSAWKSATDFVAGLWDRIKAKVSAVADWVLGKLAPIRSAWAWVTGSSRPAIGSAVSRAPAAPGAAVRAPARAALPTPARAGRMAAVTDQRQYHFTIQQQPGQNAQALAREVAQHLRQADATRARGALYDRAAA